MKIFSIQHPVHGERMLYFFCLFFSVDTGIEEFFQMLEYASAENGRTNYAKVNNTNM